MTDRGRSGHQPGAASSEAAADVGERVHARFLERRERGELQPFRPPAPPPAPEPPSVDAVAAEVGALQASLDLLRRQVEAALAEVEPRLEVAGTGAAAALKLAEEAGGRARAAADRADQVMAAAEGLAAELGRFAAALPPELADELDAALDRFRSRLQSA